MVISPGPPALSHGDKPRCEKCHGGVLKGFDAVIHLADLSNDALGQFSPTTTRKINFHGSCDLAEKCKEAGVRRFVYSSSCSVYGVGNDEIKDEESTLNPQTTYAECKALVEEAVSKLADNAFTTVFLRNATVFGASPACALTWS